MHAHYQCGLLKSTGTVVHRKFMKFKQSSITCSNLDRITYTNLSIIEEIQKPLYFSFQLIQLDYSI